MANRDHEDLRIPTRLFVPPIGAGNAHLADSDLPDTYTARADSGLLPLATIVWSSTSLVVGSQLPKGAASVSQWEGSCLGELRSDLPYHFSERDLSMLRRLTEQSRTRRTLRPECCSARGSAFGGSAPALTDHAPLKRSITPDAGSV